jgi:uncharacterized radical SAM superfamily protein
MLRKTPLSSKGVARIPRQAASIDPSRWDIAWQVRRSHHPPVIRFDRPTKTLPVSLTGPECELSCAHCGGHYLKHMRPISDAHADGATSCLISGGCDSRGRVPVACHLDETAILRQGRRLNWHVGLIEEGELRAIAPFVDVISFDVVGDAETAREVYGLDLELDDYMRTLDMLRAHRPVVPHLTIGLRGGRMSGERAALEALRERDVDRVIFIVFIPTAGTAYADCTPPPLAEVADLFIDARVSLPDAGLYLGCMRPHGAYRQAVDELAVCAGLNAIVNPSRSAQRLAGELELRIIWGDECCALA